MLKNMTVKSSLVALACTISMSVHAVADAPRQIQVPAGDLVSALELVSKQAGVELVFSSEQLKGLHTRGVSGTLSTQDAVIKLLEGTRLQLRFDDATGAMMIGTTPSAPASAPQQSESRSESSSKDGATDSVKPSQETGTSPPASPSTHKTAENESLDEVAMSVPEILVRGSKSLNMDIRRTEDDAQPYVVFDKETIERSGATTLENLLRDRLTMNTNALSRSDAPGFRYYGPTSSVNLRGLGNGQTLILVDGRRLGNAVTQGGVEQAQLNYIPLSIVERIEVLPATASGIYGGGATGGVVNIILRRDFNGTGVKLTYDNSFKSDSARRQVNLSHGSTFNDGRTQLLFAGSFADQNLITVGDRDFYQRARERMFANNPASILGNNAFMGATPNVQSANGSNLVLDNGTPLNSPVTFVPAGYAGLAAGDGGAALVANAGRKNLDLPRNRTDVGTGRFLQMDTTTESLWMTLRHELNSRLTLFLDAQGARSNTTLPDTGWNESRSRFTVPANAPTNPFTRDVIVTAPFAGSADGEVVTHRKNIGATIGGLFKLSENWATSLDYSWSRDTMDFFAGPGPSFGQTTTAAAAIAAVNNGTLDLLQDTIARDVSLAPYSQPGTVYTIDPHRATSRTTTLRVSGPLALQLPAGLPVLTMLAERNELDIDQGSLYSSGTTAIYPSRGRSITSFYVEGQVPLVSPAQGVPGLREVQLQLAARYDETSVDGVSNLSSGAPNSSIQRATNSSRVTSPTVALRIQPLESLTLRASASKGFVPPLPDQLTPTIRVLTSLGSLADPQRGGTPVALPSGGMPSVDGGNADMRPERSTSWSAGLILVPRQFPDFRLSLDYVRIRKTDNISAPTAQVTVDNEAVLPGRVTRGPNLPGDPTGWAGPIIGLDLSSLNLARAEIEALDLQLDYHLGTQSFGNFDFSAMASWQPHFRTQVSPASPVREMIGVTYNNPLEWKGNVSVVWSNEPWTVGWTARYFDSFLIADPLSAASAGLFLSQGADSVPSQVFHDFYSQYKFSSARTSSSSRWLDGLQIQAGVRNVFNTAPAIYLGTSANLAGWVSPYGDTRLSTYYLTMKYDF